MRSQADAPRPTQVAFIAAGFFFARSEFLMDVPFDPFVRKYEGALEGCLILKMILMFVTSASQRGALWERKSPSR